MNFGVYAEQILCFELFPAKMRDIAIKEFPLNTYHKVDTYRESI